MKVFLTSDHHFFHSRIIGYCNRPFQNEADMNTELISRWNLSIENDDVVFHIGDLSAGIGKRSEELQQIISDLNGQKFLIRGNHDHQPDEWYLQSGFKKVFDFVNLGGVLLVHYPLQVAIERGLKLDNAAIVDHVIHGHTHTVDTADHENHFNVAVDRHNFAPVTYEKAIPQQLHKNFLEAISNVIL